MPKKLDWIDVLNEQATWTSYEDLIRWLAGLLERESSPSPAVVEHFQGTLNLMRRQVSAIHFHEAVDVQAIDERLKNATVELSAATDVSSRILPLPSFRARLHGAAGDDLIRCIEQTLLIEFAWFVGEHLDDPAHTGIARCEGLYRESGSSSVSPVPAVPIEVELRWRREIPALVETGLDASPDLLRCADFFVARARGKFCSDECRFRTFQITKQLSDPDYLAEKQKRYRRRRT